MRTPCRTPSILVLTHLPDREHAEALARRLVDGRLAACVNIGAPVDSMYHWHGQIETAHEVPLTIKTRARVVRDASRQRSETGIPTNFRRSSLSPYSMATLAYLDWIAAET